MSEIVDMVLKCTDIQDALPIDDFINIYDLQPNVLKPLSSCFKCVLGVRVMCVPLVEMVCLILIVVICQGSQAVRDSGAKLQARALRVFQ